MKDLNSNQIINYQETVYGTETNILNAQAPNLRGYSLNICLRGVEVTVTGKSCRKIPSLVNNSREIHFFFWFRLQMPINWVNVTNITTPWGTKDLIEALDIKKIGL